MKNLIKKPILTAILFIFSLLQTNAQDLAFNNNSVINTESKYQFTENQTVYVCDGPYAYAYHSRSNCPGLNNCSGQILVWDEVSALSSRWNKPCCRCWSNAYNNCKDDNPALGYGSGGGGGGNGDAAAGVAVVVIFGSVIILSNDIYAYRVSSFYKDKNYSGNSNEGSGWAFGFRKTFDKSALEYGMSIIERKVSYRYGIGNSETYGLHMNYIHQIFDSKMPKNLNVYVGPTINSINGLGYGGIVGTHYKIFNRLKIDLRYEFSTQTNQVQLGLIFKYQKKYFWQ